jgi:uncharacterized membrane protein
MVQHVGAYVNHNSDQLCSPGIVSYLQFQNTPYVFEDDAHLLSVSFSFFSVSSSPSSSSSFYSSVFFFSFYVFSSYVSSFSFSSSSSSSSVSIFFLG